MTDQYALMGDPVAHSKSPELHQHFADICQQDMHYNLLQVQKGSLKKALANFIAAGGKGLNITLPLKEEAFAAVDRLNPAAKHAKAVNTIIIDEHGKATGDNTDGVGLCRDLEAHNVTLKQQRILILGAGGAARGAIYPLLQCHPKHIHIANRSPEKALQLSSEFDGVTASALHDIPDGFDVIINATSASLQGVYPLIAESIIADAKVCYDMVYSDEPTAFLNWTASLGCPKNIDGKGMLKQQAAESFFLWRGVRPLLRS